MKTRLFLLVTLVFAMIAAPSYGSAGDDAKSRMRDRVSVIDALKHSGAVGENNRGFLEVRKSEGNAAAIVQDENADRQVVFESTAARANSTAEAVGRSFARQMASASAPGVWLQRESGEWYQK